MHGSRFHGGRGLRPSLHGDPPEASVYGSAADETPESYLTNLTRQEHLRQALATLRPDEYRVLQLKDLEQRSYKEIVQDMGISLSAAKMRVQRARLALVTTYNKLVNSQAV